MPQPKKVIVLPASQVEDAFNSGRVTLKMLADLAGCSVPTMRKHLAEAYGDRMTFSRGRTGGLSLAAPAPAPAPVAAETGEDPTAS